MMMMNYDAYKIHGFTTRMILGKNSWQCVSLRQTIAAMPTDVAVSTKSAWFEGWDIADTLFEENYVRSMSTVGWIDWYINLLQDLLLQDVQDSGRLNIRDQLRIST